MREVRLVNQDGEQLGIVPVREALRIAQEQGLDLVEVAATARPPVCRLMDYGRYRYEQSKHEREARKRQKVVNIKEVKLRLRIEEHDFQVKARNAIRFLSDGDRVKVTIMFRGREMAHTELGQKLCHRLAERIGDLAVVERAPILEGRNMVMMLAPRQPKEAVTKETSIGDTLTKETLMGETLKGD